jgi:hypothetical protein
VISLQQDELMNRRIPVFGLSRVIVSTRRDPLGLGWEAGVEISRLSL